MGADDVAGGSGFRTVAQRAAIMRQAAVDYDWRRHGRQRWHNRRPTTANNKGHCIDSDISPAPSPHREDFREVTVVMHRQAKPHNHPATRNRDRGQCSATMGISPVTIVAVVFVVLKWREMTGPLTV